MKRLIAFLTNPWFSRFYLLLLLVSVAAFFYSSGQGFLKVIGQFQPRIIFLAMVAYFLGVGIIAPSLHRLAYNEIGAVVSFWQAFRVFHLSHIANYIPGKIWFATNYYLFSKKLNIDTEKIAKNFVILNVLLLFVGSICTLPVIYCFNPGFQKLLIIFPFLIAILVHPRVFEKVFGLFLRNKGGGSFRPRCIINMIMLYFLLFFLLGNSLYFCILSFKAIGLRQFVIVTTAAAASVIIGLLAVFAPAGIGVGEGISAAILSQIIPLEIAVVAAVSFRLVMIAVDLGCALISAVSVSKGG